MKRFFLLILAAIVLFFVSCTKEVPAIKTVSSADSYFPITAGSTWRYRDFKRDGSSDTITVKMTASKSTFNGKTFMVASTQSRESGAGAEYFYSDKHLNIIRSLNIYAGEVLELDLFNDTAAIGTKIISYPTDNGFVGNLAARTVNTTVEKNLTIKLGSTTFTGVIHTHVVLEYLLLSGFSTNLIYDFYLAKGIGVIESQLIVLGTVFEGQYILDYTIK